MTVEFHPPLSPPRDGHTYRIIAVARVSDPREGKQDERSLQDQEASYRELLGRNMNGRHHEVTLIAGSGSGELLDRAEYERLIELIATRRYDLVLCEDLGRIVRRVHAHLICEHAEDYRTRLIAINDHVDTAQPGWREASIFAAFHHERSNRDTSERIKRTHRNRFMCGGCLRGPMYGYVKPLAAKSDAELSKDPAADEVYREWFRMLDEDEATYADVARWLKTKGVRFPSRYKGKYIDPNPVTVARYTFNPLLKGVRERNRRKTQRHNASGKYVSQKAAPEDLLQRAVPHLAFFDAAYYDRVVAKVKARNEPYRRSDDPAADPCLYRPKKDTRFPGRVTFCGVCGRQWVWGGNGQTDHMMCNGAREHRCWLGTTFDGLGAAAKVTAAVFAAVEALEDFDSTFLEGVQGEARRLDAVREQKLLDLRQHLAKVENDLASIVENFKTRDQSRPSAVLNAELDRLEEQQRVLQAELTCLEREPVHTVKIPPVETIKALARECLKDVAGKGGPQFARVMRKLVPRIVVKPVRLCDDGNVVLRARFRLQLANLLLDRRAAEALRKPLERIVTIDLFEHPQREAFRTRVVALRKAGKTEREVAEELGITVTAAQRAAALQRKMDALGIDDPYVDVTEPPEDLAKLRRHKHPDYRFEPLPGAGEL